jgi:DNA-binding FadR family transcriptional regulator
MDTAIPQFKKLQHTPAYKLLSTQIADLVLSGKLKDGDPLPTEAVLCEQFGVNRSTVREAIRLLEETGMVRRTGLKRLHVSRPTHAEVSNQVERALLLHRITFNELWETAMVLEPNSAELAALHLTDDELLEIEENVKKTQKAVAQGSSLVELDIEFHSLIAKAMHNRVLLLAREPMSRLFYPAFSLVLSHVDSSGNRLLKAHQEILSALKQRSPEIASKWMRRHIEDFRRGYEATGHSVNDPLPSQDAGVAVRARPPESP